jgi:multidrug resistance efflux pump
MKNFSINILYWLIFPVLLFGIYKVVQNVSQHSATFYGFAENNETQINLENAVAVNRIAVRPGQFVRKGDLLLEVTRTSLDLKLSDVAHNISELQVRDEIRIAELKSNISRLQAERAEKVNDIQSRIRALEAEQTLNEALVKDLKSVKLPESAATNNLYQLKIKALEEEMRYVVQPLDVEIQRLETDIKATPASKVAIDRLKNEKQYYEKEQERLKIFAPADGLIGTIHCKEGEHISSFTAMISFYEQNPNMVVGYVHESLVLQVRVGDSLDVVSSLHADEKCRGKITGMGHRIVEIPERLRKIPEIRTYGREVLIAIPTNNHFLQKEKVVLNLLNMPEKWGNGFLSLFSKQASKENSKM